VIAVAATVGIAASSTVLGAVSTSHYAGSGNRTVAVIRLASDSVVRWTATGGSFSMRDPSGRLKVSGKARGGQSFAVRGTFRRVQIRAKGHWTVAFSALPAVKK
jgi:hypothetical protein